MFDAANCCGGGRSGYGDKNRRLRVVLDIDETLIHAEVDRSVANLRTGMDDKSSVESLEKFLAWKFPSRRAMEQYTACAYGSALVWTDSCGSCHSSTTSTRSRPQKTTTRSQSWPCWILIRPSSKAVTTEPTAPKCAGRLS